MRHLMGVIGLAAYLLIPVGAASQAPESSTNPTMLISPTVEATWFATGRGGVDHLDPLVLWRGTPGWFMEPGGSSGGRSGRSGAPRTSWVTRGTLRLTVEFHSEKRVAAIQGQLLDLADHNVVLVDDVDAPTGPRVTKMLTVARAMPGSAGQIGLVLRESPEIMSFLRCDATRPDGRGQAYLSRLCLQNIGIVK